MQERGRTRKTFTGRDAGGAAGSGRAKVIFLALAGVIFLGPRPARPTQRPSLGRKRRDTKANPQGQIWVCVPVWVKLPTALRNCVASRVV